MNPAPALSIFPQGETEIVIQRTFNAPVEMVFQAHTKPELLSKWFGVRNGWTSAVCEIDLRPGGAYCYGWRNEEKKMNLTIRGKFLEIVPPDKFVCTESFEEPFHAGEAINVYMFHGEHGRTVLTITTTYPSAEVREMALKSGMEHGLIESYFILDQLLA